MPGITTLRQPARKGKSQPAKKSSSGKNTRRSPASNVRKKIKHAGQSRQPATLKQTDQPSTGGVSMKFRLNDNNPKEKAIIDALAACGEREMSRFIKRAAYQLATGRDYDTGLPLYATIPSAHERNESEIPVSSGGDIQRRMSILADLDSGLDDWDSLSA